MSRCAYAILEMLDNQLRRMSFFMNGVGPEIELKMLKAPMTNSGCECRFAQLDVRVDFCGGSAPLHTISNKQVVAVNDFFSTEEFQPEDTKELSKWARTSEETKKANQLQDEFLQRVKMVNSLARKKKHKKKQKTVIFAVKIATLC